MNAGISKTECDTALVVKGEEVTLSSELYNNAGSGHDRRERRVLRGR